MSKLFHGTLTLPGHPATSTVLPFDQTLGPSPAQPALALRATTVWKALNSFPLTPVLTVQFQHFFRWLTLDGSGTWTGPKSAKTRSAGMILVGAVAGLGWAPVFWVPAYLLGALGLLVRLACCTTAKQGFWSGWCWAFGTHLVGLNWVGHALWVDADRFAWLTPVVVLGLPAVLALYTGGIGALAGSCTAPAPRSSLRLVVRLIPLMGAMELFQSVFLTGFPWNLVGYIWGGQPSLAVWASVVGCYGLGTLTLMGAAALVPPVLQRSGPRLIKTLAGLLTVWALMSLVGQSMLTSPTAPPTSTAVLRLVQPATPQRHSLDDRHSAQRVQALLHLSCRDNPLDPKKKPTHVIWPEDGFPWALSASDPLSLSQVFEGKNPPILLLGALYRQTPNRFYNALVAQIPGQPLAFVYGKRHLVPFGEYIPGRPFLQRFMPPSWLQKISPGSQDFTPGPEMDVVQVPGLPPVRVLVCYEAIFPDTVRPHCYRKARRHRRRHPTHPCHQPGHKGHTQPQWILMVTNDGWFGQSAGPFQHLVSAQFRAIEEGLPVIRVAKTGISTVIDARGRILNKLDVGKMGFIDTPLPPALSRRTLISRTTNIMMEVVICGIIALFCQLGKDFFPQRRKTA